MKNFSKQGAKRILKILIISMFSCILMYLLLPKEYHCYYTRDVDVFDNSEIIEKVFCNRDNNVFIMENKYYNNEINLSIKKIDLSTDSIKINGINYLINKNIGESWFSSCDHPMVDLVKVTIVKHVDTTINKVRFSNCILYSIDWIAPEKFNNTILVLLDTKNKIVINEKFMSSGYYADYELKMDSVICKRRLFSYMFFINRY